MTMTALHPARAHAGPWDGLPPLGTCSYGRYQRAMGTAVRITRMALRGVSLPDPRWTDRPHWPVIRALIPGADIFHQGLPKAEFDKRYRAGLDQAGIRLTCLEIRGITLDRPPATQRLVLLCYEDDPQACHRSVFAAWWATQTGLDVPELG